MTPEERSRLEIDTLLGKCGWILQNRSELDVDAAVGVAVREFPLVEPFGEADYLLYLDGRAVGIIEAKPSGWTLKGVEVQSQLIVIVSHVGFPQEVKLAKEIEGIDVILSAHTHNRLESPVQIGKTLLMQSGFGGSFLGRLDLTVEDGKILRWTHELIAVEESVAEDAAVLQVVNAQLAPWRNKL
ncbi:hypothetical protein EON80_19965, partial [bacterium]